jgi:uncharacterized protein
MPKGVLIAVSRTSPLCLDVSELLRSPGSARDLRFHGSVDGLAVTMAHVRQGSELQFELRAEALVDGIHVRGRMAGEVEMECRRCLRPLQRHAEVEMDELFLPPGDATVDDQAYEIVDERIDLEPAVRDAIVLALPLHPLCTPECRGLCPSCGADRNERECGHETVTTDLRWGALEQLRGTMEE